MTVNVIKVDTNLFKPEKQLLNDAEYDVRNYAERKLARRPLQTQMAALKKWLLCYIRQQQFFHVQQYILFK